MHVAQWQWGLSCKQTGALCCSIILGHFIFQFPSFFQERIMNCVLLLLCMLLLNRTINKCEGYPVVESGVIKLYCCSCKHADSTDTALIQLHMSCSMLHHFLFVLFGAFTVTNFLCSVVQRFRKTFQSLLEELVSSSNKSNVIGLSTSLLPVDVYHSLCACPVAT